MARTFSDTSKIKANMAAFEDGSNAAQLVQFITEFNLPAKVVAAHAGVSVQTIYSYVDAEDGVRTTVQKEGQIAAVVARLKELEAAGKLQLTGNAYDRAEQLNSMLTVEPSPE
jgi:hypothetical protein